MYSTSWIGSVQIPIWPEISWVQFLINSFYIFFLLLFKVGVALSNLLHILYAANALINSSCINICFPYLWSKIKQTEHKNHFFIKSLQKQIQNKESILFYWFEFKINIAWEACLFNIRSKYDKECYISTALHGIWNTSKSRDVCPYLDIKRLMYWDINHILKNIIMVIKKSKSFSYQCLPKEISQKEFFQS